MVAWKIGLVLLPLSVGCQQMRLPTSPDPMTATPTLDVAPLRLVVDEARPAGVAAPLTAPVAGTSNFAAEFMSRGPRDSKGRSLRELDLKTRLMRYPMSYLIYTEFFNELEPPIKEYLYRRIKEVLTGEDKTDAFKHLPTARNA